MAEKTGDPSFMNANAGAVNPALIILALKALFESLGKLFGWFEKREINQRNVVVCKDCGYWEKV